MEDSGPGQGRDESLSAFRQRTVSKLKRIEKEEEKLLVLMAEFRKKKQICAKVYSKKRPALRPELKDLEQAVRKQRELVSSLKEKAEYLKRNIGMRSDLIA